MLASVQLTQYAKFYLLFYSFLVILADGFTFTIERYFLPFISFIMDYTALLVRKNFKNFAKQLRFENIYLINISLAVQEAPKHVWALKMENRSELVIEN